MFFTSRAFNAWIIDTRASDHITGNKSILHELSSPLSRPIVTLANDTTSHIESVGTAKVTDSLSLSSILYIPKFPFNLLFISKLTRSLNYIVMFFPDHYVFRRLRCRGRLAHDVNMEVCMVPVQLHVLAISLRDLHRRFGHPTLQVLKKLALELGQLLFLECESCQMSKHHRVPYLLRVNNKVDPPFELVHSDIWGPCPVNLTIDFKNLIIFVDDFSRLEAFYISQTLCNEIKNQFDMSVHILRIDNVKKILSLSFIHFMSDIGSSHLTSCLYTPQ